MYLFVFSFVLFVFYFVILSIIDNSNFDRNRSTLRDKNNTYTTRVRSRYTFITNNTKKWGTII